MFKCKFIIFALIFATVASRKCLNVDPLTDFHVDNILGMWYLQAYESNKFLTDLLCITCNFTSADAENLHAFVAGKDYEDDDFITYNVNLTFVGPRDIANFTEYIRRTNFDDVFSNKVIDTDYKTYLIYYGCSLNGKKEYIFVFSKDKDPEDLDKFLREMYEILQKKNIPTTHMIRCDQSDCPK